MPQTQSLQLSSKPTVQHAGVFLGKMRVLKRLKDLIQMPAEEKTNKQAREIYSQITMQTSLRSPHKSRPQYTIIIHNLKTKIQWTYASIVFRPFTLPRRNLKSPVVLRKTRSRADSSPVVFRDLTQNTTARATRTSPNKKISEQNNSCARAL